MENLGTLEQGENAEKAQIVETDIPEDSYVTGINAVMDDDILAASQATGGSQLCS